VASYVNSDLTADRRHYYAESRTSQTPGVTINRTWSRSTETQPDSKTEYNWMQCLERNWRSL